MESGFSLSKNFDRAENEIGRGGVHGATAAIFLPGNPISRRKIVSFRISRPETVGFK